MLVLFSTLNKRKEINDKVRKKLRKHPDEYYIKKPKIVWPEGSKKYLNRESVHRCRAKRKGLFPDDADLIAIKKFYCNTPDGYEVDHIIPFAKGGLHHQDNLQYLTPFENKSKGNK